MKERLTVGIVWLVTLSLPFLLGFTVIGVTIQQAELYLRYQYLNNRNFPPDLYRVMPETIAAMGLEPLVGEQRVEMAMVAVDFLNRSEPAEEIIYLLGDQVSPTTGRVWYNEAELQHMVDVKNVTDGVKRINWVLLGLILVSWGYLWWQGEKLALYRSVRNGGMMTMGILVGLGLFMIVAWDLFFVQFHELLFPPGSWTFAYSDGLIRLFPEKFWFDVGMILSGLPLLAGVVVTAVGWWLVRRETAK
ncbi:MAG TPA: DUF1461 domain-containing protein [Anaerolineae bacterium]|nr:DUF1461 domain-containing protein [Anaerolineae bacterium]